MQEGIEDRRGAKEGLKNINRGERRDQKMTERYMERAVKTHRQKERKEGQ